MGRRALVAVLGSSLTAATVAGPGGPRAAGAPSPTFARDVAPIVAVRCAPCHRPGGGAPFPLLTYDDLKRRATTVGDLVSRRRMPPWLPAQGAETFLDARRLDEHEKRTIEAWVAGGAPEGDGAAPSGASAPGPATQVGSGGGWGLGVPDLVLETGVPFELAGDGRDEYRSYVVGIPTVERRYVRAVELLPSAPAVVHHAVIALDRTGTARWLDVRDDAPGFDGRLTGPAQGPEGFVLGWTPGRRPAFLPDGLAWRLDPGGDLVLQLHLVPSGRRERISVRVGLYFASEPPREQPALVRVGSTRIDIPAGVSRHRTRDDYVLPVDVRVLSVYPHAHLLARDVRAWAELPDGGVRDLLRIDRWDFAWQDEYRYRTPLHLPRATRLRATWTFDHSADNPANPVTPPVRVVYGPLTAHEMGDVWLQVVPLQAADRRRLARESAARELDAGVAGHEILVSASPGEAEYRVALGTLYAARGDAAKATAQYREVLRLEPESTLASYNLAVALRARGENREARALLTQVVATNPAHAHALHALGHLWLGDADPTQALAFFDRAIAAWPGFADALNSRANLLASLGRRAEAEADYRQALAAAPDHLAALNNLAILLAGAGRVDEAVRLLERAVAADPAHVPSRQNLESARAMRRGPPR